MISLVYMSVAVDAMTDEDLRAMLRQARLRNEALGVTGLLVAKGGRFMQVLEGPKWSVEDRYNVIRADIRHAEVRSVSLESIQSRRFEAWTMAFGNPTTAELAAEPGLSAFLTQRGGLPGELRGAPADWLLRWFRSRDLIDVPDDLVTLDRAA